MKITRRAWLIWAAGLFAGSMAQLATGQVRTSHSSGAAVDRQEKTYFDAHSFSYPSMLPFYVYANPPKFLEKPSPRAVRLADRRELLESLYRWSRRATADEADRSMDPRITATLQSHPQQNRGRQEGPSQVLARILTARPSVGSGSAYAFRKIAESEYLEKAFKEYQPNPDLKNYRLLHDLCSAGILQTGLSNVAAGETDIDFTRGWQINPVEFRSDQEKSVLCFMFGPAELKDRLSMLGHPVPDMTVLLAVNAVQLARTEAAEGGEHSRNRQSRCVSSTMTVPLPADLLAIHNALMGKEEHGCEIAEFLEDAPDGGVQLTRFYSTVVGLDIGGIGDACPPSGEINYCKELVRTVYEASKARRDHGWHGRMLVRFDLSQALTASEDAGSKGDGGLKVLLAAVQELEQELGDLHDYVILRAGGLSRIREDEVHTMAELGMEGDVHLVSGVTGRGSCGVEHVHRIAASGGSPLRTLLVNRVRVLLSTNGAGVERCDAAGQYRLAEFMISYWNRKDPEFRRRAISIHDIDENVRSHLEAMRISSSN